MNSKPKVLYISHTSDFHGSGKALLNIMVKMKEIGVDVNVILPVSKGELYNAVKKHNIPHSVLDVISCVWPFPIKIRDYFLFPYRFSRFLYNKSRFQRDLLNKTVAVKPDIIHTNVGVLHAGHYVAKKLKIPHVWHIREYQDLHFGWKAYPSNREFMRLLTEENNYPIAITNGVYEHHSLFQNKNSKVIYDGVFSIDNIPKIKYAKKKYFLFVGLISEGKGTEEAIKSFISVSNVLGDYELWIAGSGDTQYVEKLIKLSAKFGLRDKIKFLGFRTDVYMLMSEATALIVPSKFEGFGFITAEAMFNGCLVIGRNTAGTKEQFDNGRAIYGYDVAMRYNTSDELSLLLFDLCHKGIDSHLKNLLRAQETVVKLYSIQQNTKRILTLYKNMLKHNEN